MFKATIAGLILSAAASPDDPHGPECRLTAAECTVVAREVAVDDELFAQDREILGIGLSPTESARALIARDGQRMAERFRHLPAAIGDEVARIQFCRVLGETAPRDGTTGPDARCR